MKTVASAPNWPGSASKVASASFLNSFALAVPARLSGDSVEPGLVSKTSASSANASDSARASAIAASVSSAFAARTPSL